MCGRTHANPNELRRAAYNGVRSSLSHACDVQTRAAAAFRVAAVSMTVLAGCSCPSAPAATTAGAAHTVNAAATSASDAPLPGMPPVLDVHNIYAADGPGV